MRHTSEVGKEQVRNQYNLRKFLKRTLLQLFQQRPQTGLQAVKKIMPNGID